MKNLFLEKYCDLIPCFNFEDKMFLRSENTKLCLAKRRLRLNHSMSSSEPIISRTQGRTKRPSRCSSLPRMAYMQSVEVKLLSLFGGNSKDDCCSLVPAEDVEKDKDAGNNSVNDLIMSLEDEEVVKDNHLPWGNTYPVNNPKVIGDMPEDGKHQLGNTYPLNSPKVIESSIDCVNSDEKSSQSREISTTQNITSLEPPNTQAIWDDLYTKLSGQPNQKIQHQSTSPQTSANNVLEARNNNQTEAEETFDSCEGTQKTLNNSLSDEELLQYLCFHSFELIDFKDNKVWEKLASKKGLNEESCQFYKQHFLDYIVKHAYSYRIPTYFSNYLTNYNSDLASTLSSELIDSVHGSNEENNINRVKDNFQGKKVSQDTVSENPVEAHSSSSTRKTLSKSYKRKSSDCSPDLSNSPNAPGALRMKPFNKLQNKGAQKKRSKMGSEYEMRSSEWSDNSDDRSDENNTFRKCNRKSSEINNKQPCYNRLAKKKQSCVMPLSDSESGSKYSVSSESNESSVEEQVKRKSKTKSNVACSRPNRIISDSSDTDDVFSPLNISGPSKAKTKSGPSLSPAANRQCSNSLARTSITSSYFICTPSGTKRRPSKLAQNKGLYLHHEKLKMLTYLESQSSRLHAIKGNVFWKEMEAAGVLPGRPWQSLKNHFSRYLINDLAMYNLSPNFESKLRRYSQKCSR